MKKLLALVLVALMAISMFCACGEPDEEGKTGAPGSVSAKELMSSFRYTAHWEDSDSNSTEETIVNIQWTENGAVVEGYETSSSGRSEMHIDAVFDDQKRPASMTRTVTQADGETRVTEVTFSYPDERTVSVTSTTGSETNSTYTTTYVYNENGKVIRQEYDDRTRGYEYDSKGNCVRQWMEFEDEETQDWEETTVYTYDDSGKAIYSVATRGDEETQTRYYYYPNGNVMFFVQVTSSGDVNYAFRPYNPKDGTWSYGMSASGGIEYKAEKDANGYIIKVTGTYTHSGENITATFAYDDKGNLIQNKGFYDTVSSWEYDDQSRLVKYVRESDATYTTEYEYDDLGRLVSEKMTSTNGSSRTQTRTYNEAGMVTMRQEVRVSVYSDETTTYDKKMEIQYVENSQCAVNQDWAEFFLQNVTSGIM